MNYVIDTGASHILDISIHIKYLPMVNGVAKCENSRRVRGCLYTHEKMANDSKFQEFYTFIFEVK